MADGKFLIGKPAGGVTTVSMTDGVDNTNLVLPESGTVATIADVNNGAVLLKTIAAGTATFTATTNNINLTGIGIGVDIGDVIQISGATDSKNNSEFTIEVITDDDNIIVNQAHSNLDTSKNVATRAGDTGVTVKLLAKWYNASDGLGQDWVNVAASRALGTMYTNYTKRTINIAIAFGTSGTSDANVWINGEVVWSQVSVSASLSSSNGRFPISKDATYAANNSAGGIVAWFERR